MRVAAPPAAMVASAHPDSVQSLICTRATKEGSWITMPSDDKSYEDRVVYLTDLIDRTGPPRPLDGFTFVRCVLRGPVVLAPMDGFHMSGCRLDTPSADAMFYEIEPGYHLGIVPVMNWTMEDCTLENVALAGSAELRAMLLGGTS
ncbi:hypothetical protein OEB99_17895 [Actinotalea sp. M2MS4P-6]|uniref:hypothetical protein n=1 Tax=Actinotalea sp. M2MS4P-6 TaxID=2983762 RepID=UPI0021E36EE3|nr:hypothetical protein [Actinotalea sp. M2MS4P-6]MCV2396187.1 hypothetical protein [Actinotalea sp. M2MS4P-6]